MDGYSLSIQDICKFLENSSRVFHFFISSIGSRYANIIYSVNACGSLALEKLTFWSGQSRLTTQREAAQ